MDKARHLRLHPPELETAMTVTRFAPSPTGLLHVGNLRTALFNHLIARKTGGTFILRIDDTDPDRSKQEYVDQIQRDLEWLGLTWDRIERQSARLDRYAEAADRLRDAGRFYEAFETPTELDLKRKKQLNMGKPPVYDRAALALSEDEKAALRAERGDGVWRFKLDHERIEWDDGILGPVSIDAASVSDPVLIRADGQVLYTIASVVDDTEMGVTHVVRGNDHVTNTATQIQIIAALGGTTPAFAHHSLLTGPGGESLSKRLGTLSLKDLREQGVEPEALLSLMARLGSSQPVELRMSLDEIAEGFDLSTFGSAPTKFDAEDLWPLTARKLHGLPYDAMADEIRALGVPDALAPRFWEVARANITRRSELSDWWNMFSGGATPLVDPDDEAFVAEAFALLGEPPYDETTWSSWTNAVKEATGRKGKGLFMPLRKAVTGQQKGPEMADVMALMQVRPGPRH
jgi:glutamyl-tRNA synthetase